MGKRPRKEVRIWLDRVTNYEAALDEAMPELSKLPEHKFPPLVSHYKSFDLEAIAR